MSRLSVRVLIATTLLLSAAYILSCAGLPSKNSSLHPRDSFLFIQRSTTVTTCVADKCKDESHKISGSGFVVDVTLEGSIALTAGHVCAPLQGDKSVFFIEVREFTSMKATLSSGELVDIEILAMYEDQDLCVVLIPNISLVEVPVADKAPTYGDKVHTLAAPLGIYRPKAVPIFSGSYFGAFEDVSADLYSIPTIFGSSGSPILNEAGEVVGVTSRSYPAFPQIAMSPRYEDVRKLIDEIKNGKMPYSL